MNVKIILTDQAACRLLLQCNHNLLVTNSSEIRNLTITVITANSCAL